MSRDTRYHLEWETISRYLRELFNYHCARCGLDCRNANSANSVLQVHHIDENPGNNDIDNLIPLCASCHLKIEKEARLHAPSHGKQMELFEGQTYMDQMAKLRRSALEKYGTSSTPNKAKTDLEAYEIQAMEWEINEP